MTAIVNKLVLPLTVLTVLSVLSGPAAADTADTLGDLVTAASPLARLSDDSMQGRGWGDIQGIHQAEQACQKQIDLALAGGIKLDQEIELPRLGPIDRMPHTRVQAGDRSFASGSQDRTFSTLGLMRKFCKDQLVKAQLLRTYLTVGEAHEQLAQLRSIGASTEYRVRLAAARQRACAREVKRALDARIDPRTKIGVEPDGDEGSGENELTLAEAQAKICEPLAAQVETVRNLWKNQQLQARIAALSGDRRKVFDEQALWLEAAFGAGKTPLASPEEFKAAPTWYVVLEDRNDLGGKGWILRSFRFDGDKLVDTREVRGDGEAPLWDDFK